MLMSWDLSRTTARIFKLHMVYTVIVECCFEGSGKIGPSTWVCFSVFNLAKLQHIRQNRTNLLMHCGISGGSSPGVAFYKFAADLERRTVQECVNKAHFHHASIYGAICSIVYKLCSIGLYTVGGAFCCHHERLWRTARKLPQSPATQQRRSAS